jgi:O-antigen ligase
LKALRYILLSVFFCLCAGSLFAISAAFVNDRLTPKWYFTVFCALVGGLIYTGYMLPSGKNRFLRNIPLEFGMIVIVLCTLQALYGTFQYLGIFPSVNGFRVTGSFDNPAGFAASLCAGLPFLFCFCFEKKPLLKYLSIVAVACVTLAVVLSASRAGMLSLAAVYVSAFIYRFRPGKKTVIAGTMAIILLLSGLYYWKKDSADGRLLIWRCSWEMIKDKPLFGFGYGGFKASYMNFQAKYFVTHPDSEYVMLADNVRHPFNEYLLLAVNFGLLGLLVLFMLFYQLWKIHKRHPSKPLPLCMAYCCLLSIGVFALFSYPLKYPFVLIMGLLSLYICGCFRKPLLLIKKTVMTGAILLVCYLTFDRMFVEIKWNRTARQSLLGKTKQMLPEYRLLHDKLRMNDLFLYNYTAELNIAKRYDESLEIARECERLLADYDLQMLMADNYKQLKRYREAERHYTKASYMCPVKLMPLYGLVNMYQEEGKETEALSLANTILRKKIKVPSVTVSKIRNEMRQLLNSKDKQQPEGKRQDKVLSEESLETVLPP